MNYYEAFKMKEFIKPLNISIKEEVLAELTNIEGSFTGRVDARFANTFLLESVKLIVNAINLFEQGFFDCAMYSLRQSLEISTTMIYLTELKGSSYEEQFKDWKTKQWFPMYSGMIKFLKQNKDDFSNIYIHLTEYFDRLNVVKNKLNKFVHKQGFDTFYVSRNHFVNTEKDSSAFIEEFESYLIDTVGAVSVFRLAIDPFPILLMDKEIYLRTNDTMTYPYSEVFVKKYIGEDTLTNYKKTNIYQRLYDEIKNNNEPKLPEVAFVVKDNYIDLTKLNEIKEQQHLLKKTDVYAIAIFSEIESASRLLSTYGLVYCSSNTNINEPFPSVEDYIKLRNNEIFENHLYKYDNDRKVYFTSITFDNDQKFLSHNKALSKNEIDNLRSMLCELS